MAETPHRYAVVLLVEENLTAADARAGPLAARGHRGPRRLPRADADGGRPRPRPGRHGRVRRAGARPGARPPARRSTTSTRGDRRGGQAARPSASSANAVEVLQATGADARPASWSPATRSTRSPPRSPRSTAARRSSSPRSTSSPSSCALDWTSQGAPPPRRPRPAPDGAGELRRAGRRRRGRVARPDETPSAVATAPPAATYAAVLDGATCGWTWTDRCPCATPTPRR